MISKFNLFFCYVRKVYDIVDVRVKTADKRWNNLRHNYELTLTPSSIVRLVDDPTIDASIPDIYYNFIPLRDVSKYSTDSYIGIFKRLFFFYFDFYLNKDVLGIVDTCSNIIPFTNRISNRDSFRREITLIDKETSISITLWDEQVKCMTIKVN